MEAIITIVGFLGAGKTTFLNKLVSESLASGWLPHIVLNDYSNANIDAQQFANQLGTKQVDAISGSCICCDGLTELRTKINQIPKREKAVTFIEANGTTDACTLMGFLGVGLQKHFLPPIQVAIVDLRAWQKRGAHNELEANQVQASSLIVLNYTDKESLRRKEEVTDSIKKLNPEAEIIDWNEANLFELLNLSPSSNTGLKMDHSKSHWSACSVDLPDPMDRTELETALHRLPKSILRVKGCTRLIDDDQYSYFERLPDGEISFKPFYGKLIAGPKLLAIGPGSDPSGISSIIENASHI